MSTADRFAQETTNAANALGEAHSVLAGLAHGYTAGAAVQDPAYLAHTLSELRLAASQVEFILAGLYRRATRAAGQDTYPAPVRELTAAIAVGLRNAHAQAHTAWHELEQVEDHAAAINTAARTGAHPTRSAAADRFAAEAGHAVNALGAAHTILAGLSQREYGGRAVLDAEILAHAVSRLREVTASLELILHIAARHTHQAGATQDYPDAVGEWVASLATALTTASAAARATTRVLRRLENQAAQLRTATAGTHFSL
ncbi:MAG TPA: hypothetical protein VFW65_35215 [Pseudonocardiaceae bacterium]|nr:hypothetical protein [Pseudonocardiaceae bacterium]